MENKELISRAIQYIQSMPQSMLSLQDVADKAGFSLPYFDSMFERHTGYTVIEYARIFKLTRAAIALRRTDQSILDIALDYGYANPENFSRAFRTFYGASPSEYRKQHRDKPLTLHDISGKTTISRFAKYLPKLRMVSPDAAVDSLMLNGRPVYDVELTELQMADCGVFTFDEQELPRHFVIVQDYGVDLFTLIVVSDDEDNAISYLHMVMDALPKARVGFTVPSGEDYTRLSQELTGCPCQVFSNYEYKVPDKPKTTESEYTVRMLGKEDLGLIDSFGQACCCQPAMKALTLAIEGNE